MAFEKGEEPENSLILAIGKEILEKCVGVPLAIRDYHINKSTLVNLWAAQGFIKLSDQDQSFEDVGDEYFLDLLWSSFFQQPQKDEYGDVISCKMHDLMHDLAVSMARSLIKTLDYEKKAINEKTCHLSIDDKFPCVVPNFKVGRMRTILFQFGPTLESDIDLWTKLSTWDSLKFFRLLDVSNRVLSVVPSSIGDLKHLRYLDLSRNSMEKLPDSLTKLQNLQTLRLYGCDSLQELPKDMKNLVNLRHLEIDKCLSLCHMPCGLGQMTNLRTLSEFVWINYEMVEGDEMLLEWLQPHPNLKKLTLEHYHGVTFPNWLFSLINLVDLKLDGCRKLQYLPPLSQLPSLKSLSLLWLEDLDYILDSGNSNMFSASSSSTPFAYWPSLREIYLYSCPKFKGWCRRDGFRPNNHDLMIQNCPMLTSMPNFHIFKGLYLSNTNWKPVQQTMMMYMAAPQSLSTAIAPSCNPLSKLKRLELDEIADLQFVTEEGLQNLICLQYLSITRCERLQSLSRGIQHLTTLQELHLSCCNELDLGNDEDEMQWQGLKSLLSLKLYDLPKLESLPSGLQHVTTLRELEINGLGFTAIPEWIHKWTSLEEFTIKGGPSLASLPEGMCQLTSLRTLTIDFCAILSPRCKRETGEEGQRFLISQTSSIHLS
ncbi:Disease resistance protein RGA2 [Morella rubra]|uniref:Disease resistance protein RGA2 n=1 Tax=Morella rubra TaxID=262757 RepID=A0A6A1WPM4_9ROSI|nr:Disease resistance protein RGA2 [Morella rubra]